MLPQELIDRIIECDKDDVTALRDYSLVCRSWTVSSQRHLFSSICLEPGKKPGTSPPLHNSESFLVSGPFHRFALVAQRSPHILRYPRRIGLSSPSHWHDVLMHEFVGWVMSLIPALTNLRHLTLQLFDAVHDWQELANSLFAYYREREAMHHPTSISISIADPFMVDFGFLRNIAVRHFSLVGGATSEEEANNMYIPPEGDPALFGHLRTLTVSLDPDGMRRSGAWLARQSSYLPKLEELEFSVNDDEEIIAAYSLIAAGLPPSVSILSLYGERNAFYFNGELEKAVIPAISVPHLKLRLDTMSISNCITECITWWISLIASILANRCTTYPRVLTISYLHHSFARIAELDSLIAALPSLTTIYVVDNSNHLITFGNASMVEDVRRLFPQTFAKGLFSF